MNLYRWTAASTAALLLTLAACAGALDEQSAHAASAHAVGGAWPPVWQDAPEPAPGDFTPPAFEPPNAAHCHTHPAGVKNSTSKNATVSSHTMPP